MRRLIIRVGIALVVIASGVAFLRSVYLVVTSKFDKTNVPDVVMSSPSPVALPAHHAFSRTGRISWRVAYHESSSAGNNAQFPSASMSPSQGLFTTNRAQVHIIGGGGGSAYATTSAGNTSSRGITYNGGSVVMPMTNFIALTSSHPMARPEAQEAPQMAGVAPRHAPGPPDLGGEEPPGEHQLIEQPIGDALWLLLLLAIGYAAVIRIGMSHRRGN